MEATKLNDKKTIRAWAIFDWANSAYSLVISTAIFPPFFAAMTADTIRFMGWDISNTAIYSFAISVSFFLLTFVNPIFAGIADSGGKRKFFLKLFTTLGALACMSLFFFNHDGYIWWGTLGFIIATFSFTAGTVFYNAYLPEIVSDDKLDNVSAKGYAYGYVGSVILLIFILFMIQSPETFGISEVSVKEGLPARIGFLLVGIWWIGFAQYSFVNLPVDSVTSIAKTSLKNGYKQLRSAFRSIKKDKYLKRFLASFFFYISGVNTIIYLATVFAQEVIGFEQGELIITVLIIQLVAIAGAYLFAWVSKLRGNKISLAIMLMIWIAICVVGFFVSGKGMFFGLAGFVGMVMGGIQSLSRSTFSKLISGNKQEYNSYFALYDAIKNVAIVFGTLIFGLIDTLTSNMRFSILMVGVFFLIGLIFLMTTNLERTDYKKEVTG